MTKCDSCEKNRAGENSVCPDDFDRVCNCCVTCRRECHINSMSLGAIKRCFSPLEDANVGGMAFI